jgi:hypothetical protein
LVANLSRRGEAGGGEEEERLELNGVTPHGIQIVADDFCSQFVSTEDLESGGEGEG